MITELTKEMEELMFQVRADWVDLALNRKRRLKKEEIEDDLKWVYENISWGEPQIFIAESYRAQKEMINDFVKNSTCKEVVRRVLGEVEGPALRQMLGQVWDQAESRVRWQVEEQVMWQVDEQVRVQVWEQVKEQVIEQVKGLGLSFIEQDFGLGPRPGWMSYGDFFHRIGVVKSEYFLKYMNMHKKGIWDIVYFDKAVFIAEPPIKVIKNKKGKLHSISEPTVQWGDGNCNYFLYGVRFREELWRDITRGKMSIEEILDIESEGKRYAALATYGPERLLEELEAKLIDKERRNELYEITGLIKGQKVKLLKYERPSTGEECVIFVPPKYNSVKTAMKWKSSVKEGENEYNPFEEAINTAVY